MTTLAPTKPDRRTRKPRRARITYADTPELYLREEMC
jgi:hypothetical protein